MKELEIQILEYNYWEHFKSAKDMAMVLPLNHPRRVAVEKEMNLLQERIRSLKGELNKKPE